MKLFIIFLAFIMLFSLFMAYTADMNKYILLQKDLKVLCEDAANAGALCIDEQSGTINEAEALSEAKKIISSCEQFDGYEINIISFNITRNGLGCRIELEISGPDIFRLPFLKISSVRRISEYAWE